MATTSNIRVPTVFEKPAAASSRPEPAVTAAPLPLFRFRLRHLLGFVAGLSALLAALVATQGMAAVAVLLATLVVCLHVMGTALGYRLRSYSDRHPFRKGEVIDHARSQTSERALSTGPAAQKVRSSPWYGRSGTTFAWVPRIVALTALFGGALGAIFFALTIGHRTSLAGLVVGSISLAVLSGWLAFLAGNLFGIVRGGFTEALREDDLPLAGKRVKNCP